MTAVVLDPVEFAARRRKSQDEVIAALLPFADDFIERGPEAALELADALVQVYLRTYLGEGGERQARTAAFIYSLRGMLTHTEPDSNPTAVATWLAVATINAATVQAAADDPRPTVLTWLTMHDSHVREAHAVADRQRRPAGSRFLVGGEMLLYPGDPRGSLDNVLNCRCTLQLVPLNQVASAASGTLVASPKETTMPMETPLAWHGVLAPEGVWSGDGRRFAPNSLRNRDLPLPLTWQKATNEGHDTSTTVARIDSIERVDGMVRGEGVFVDTPETDEIVGLIAEFGRFGVSVDADDSEFEFDEEGQKITFTSARIASASIVSIPAFAEAYITLGTWAEEAAGAPPFPPKKKKKEEPNAPADAKDPTAPADAKEPNAPADTQDPNAPAEEECDPNSPDYEDCLAKKAQDKGLTVPAETPPPGYSLGTSAGVVEMISDATWDGSAGRFTPEQWKKSTILHVCDGLEKSCHKLPIREPGGALSRAGVHAAASRFNQVDAPAEAKASAARQLRGAYRQLGEEVPDAIKASFDEAVSTYGRGPGWVTNPEDTRRLWAYWTQPGHEGYAKIGWGVAGDFNRCRAMVGEEIGENSPEDLRFLNQICAQWHHDATGFWPGRAPTEQSLRIPNGTVAASVSLVSSGVPKAPAAWFADPKLPEPTHLTVTEDGRVFGHIAEWSTCHIGYDGVCVAPPSSNSDYAYFATGTVLLDNGETASTGVISLGGGHAPARMGLRAAVAHYDSTSSAAADVCVGEDEHGIWCSGWIRPGVPAETAYALRASDISGDWRDVSGNMEMVAALAVNVAGFPVAAVRDKVQVALVAAGVVEKPDDPVNDVVTAVLAALSRRDKMARLRERVG